MTEMPFELQRLGIVMEPEHGNPLERGGVLNPAAARGPNGDLYLFPRCVEPPNYSRIAIARVRFNSNGDPIGVERLGIALQPEADYELRPEGGGCEDPRITFVEPLKSYVMTYTAFSSAGPRIALAISEDLFHWRRLGLATFLPWDGIDFNGIDNKDAVVFPVPIADPDGKPSLAIIHRPLFPGTEPHEIVAQPVHRPIDIHRESIWISYGEIHSHGSKTDPPAHFKSHHRLASPVADWERLKIGAGTPPVLTSLGWLLVYHGVSEVAEGSGGSLRRLRYSAGVLILSKEHPRFVLYRSPRPALKPEARQEVQGIVTNVVFPTAIDQRLDLGRPGQFDIYYGMADDRIGAARLDLPDHILQP